MVLMIKPLLAKVNPPPKDSCNNVFIFTLNLEDCIPCLNNSYVIADFLIKNHVPKEKILFVMNERRKMLEKNYEEEVSHIFESKKIFRI